MNETTTPTTQPTPQKAFIVRVNPGSKVALEHNVVGIGWSKLTEMNPKWTWGELKRQIKDVYPNYEGRGLGNVAGSIERFCLESGGMKIGDYVLMPVERGFHLGIVKSGVKRCDADLGKKAPLQWQRDVEWLTKSKGAIPRGCVDNKLEIRLKSRQTCIDASDCIEQINKVLNLESYEVTPFNDRVREKSKEIVKQELNAINDRRLEKLISALCVNAGGKVLAKKDPKPGDADVQAEYPVMVGNQKYVVRVLYQAKKHSGTSNDHGIRQLINRIKSLSEDEGEKDRNIIAYKGCLVTTASSVTVEAEMKAADVSAEQLEIDILTLDDLADWILDAGLSDLNV
jgi:predicted Mrr-cat superfamily restriction endonuclease